VRGVVHVGDAQAAGVSRCNLPERRSIEAERPAQPPLGVEDLLLDPVARHVHQPQEEVPQQRLEPGGVLGLRG
jgi:hypothetical protein